MEWGFEERRFQALKIAALSHPDPSLRETAANVLLWDEPVAAEGPLLAALDDTEERVAASAANTLQYSAEDAIPRLAKLAAHDEREPLRLHAIYALTRLDAARAIEPLLSLLEAPPLMTWSVHVALLEACRTLGLAPRGLDALREVDNLDVQQAITRIGRPSS